MELQSLVKKVAAMVVKGYTVHLLPKDLRFEHGSPNLVLDLGAGPD